MNEQLLVTDSRYYDANEQMFAELLPFLATSLVVLLLIYIIIVVGFWFLFKKAGEQGWKSLIPFYNFYILFQIADLNPWLSLLLYLPPTALIMEIILCIKLAKAFGQGVGFTIGIILFPPIFIWILAASNNYEYQLAKGKHIPFAEAFERPDGSTEPPTNPTDVSPEPPHPSESTP